MRSERRSCFWGACVLGVTVLLAGSDVIDAALAQETAVVDTPSRNAIEMGRLDQLLERRGRSSAGNIVQFRLPFATGRSAGRTKLRIPLIVPDKIRRDLDAGGRGVGRSGAYEGSGGATHLEIEDNGGFTAFTQTETYTMMIEGTNISYEAGGRHVTGRSAGGTFDRYDGFTPTVSGGVATFIYAGANYMVTIDCKDGGNDCINQQQADRLIEEFILCNLRGRCLGAGGGRAANEIRRGVR